MVSCPGCGVKNFISADLAPLSFYSCTRCGSGILVPMQLRQFELRSVVGSGGMGTVYRAFDTKLLREVAIKLMKRELAEDPQACENFCKEAQACAALNHTNIIHIYTFDDFEGQQYIALEVADCGSLDNRIEKEQRVPELDVLDIGYKLVTALTTALKHKLLHLDIKPGNILFNSEGEPKLIDFGLARNPEVEKKEYEVLGTPYYLAPERILERREDFRSDMYSLAGTLYHALTGRVPFDGETNEDVVAAQAYTPLTPPAEICSDITPLTNEAIVRALAKNPDDRFQSYDEFAMALYSARSYLLVQKYQVGGDE